MMGYSVVTTVLSAAISQDLTDLTTVKDEMSLSAGNTANDAWLRRAIANVSATMATYCQRVFVPELIRDSFDVQRDAYPYQTPGGFAQLQLTRWPVLKVLSIQQTLAPGTVEILTEGTDYRVDTETGEVLRLNRYTGTGTLWEATPLDVTYVAGFGEIVDLDATIPTPPTVAPVAETLVSCPVTITGTAGATFNRVTRNPSAGQFTVSAAGFTFNVADAGKSVTISYAARDVPLDLVDIALRLITARYKAKDRDPALVQLDTPEVGTQRFWVGGTPGQTGPFPPDIAGQLDQYNMPVVM